MKSSSINKSILSSVHNGLSILKLFSKDSPIWGITDISKELNLPKSTVSRLITELVNEGYLQKVNGKYRLGLSVLSLAGAIISNMELHREAYEPLKSLVNRIQETAHISTMEGSQLIYFIKVECKQPVRLFSQAGHYRPPTCSGPGKLLLAFQSHLIINEVIKGGLPKKGPNSITDPKILLKQLEEIRLKGYSIAIDEMHENAVSIAAPIKDYQGKVIAAVSIAGPRERIQNEYIPRLIEEITKTGKEISSRLGYIESVYLEEEM